MKNLYLVRHAKSSWKEPGAADIDRPLNGRGKKDAPGMGRRLADLGVKPDVLVTSPARRARATARRFAEVLGYDVEAIAVADDLYGTGAAAVVSVVNGLDDGCRSAIVFGHNPAMTEAARLLTGLEAELPTCAVVAATFDVASWREVREGGGALAFYEFPKLE